MDDLQPGVANRIKEGMSVGGIDEANRLIESYEQDIARQNTEDLAQNAPNSADANDHDNASQADRSSADEKPADGD